MSEEKYKRMVKAAGSGKAGNAVVFLDTVMPIILGAVYIFIAIYRLFTRENGFLKEYLKYLLIPAAVFAAATVLRQAIGRKRPYEVWDLGSYFRYRMPAHGSLPSRHTASAFAVAFAVFFYCKAAGIACFILAAAVGIVRFISGKHYISDIAAGTALAAAICIPAFILI